MERADFYANARTDRTGPLQGIKENPVAFKPNRQCAGNSCHTGLVVKVHSGTRRSVSA